MANERYVTDIRGASPESERLHELIQTALVAAFDDGARSMREKIVGFASSEHAQEGVIRTLGAWRPRFERPRKRITTLISEILTEYPALPLNQVEAKVHEIDGRIAMKSIGLELRENESTLYRVERGKWSLISEEPAEPTDKALSADPEE